MAERLEDSAMLAYASTARHFCLQRPEVTSDERIEFADRAVFGLLHAAIAETQRAASHFGEAVALHEKMRTALWLPHTLSAREALGVITG